MFTGIIEQVGTISEVAQEGTGLAFWINSSLSAELHVDQSLSHDGVCLTVEELRPGSHRVTAVQETLAKTGLRHWSTGRRVNLERAMVMGGRLDGHLVEITGEDDGPGIPEAQREEAFRPFHRLDEGRNLQSGGSGLGLAIVATMAADHHAYLRVRANQPRGTRFAIEFPATHAQHPA